MIERVQIKNYRSIRELDLPLKPINILIGSNGAGKSNFISFFKLVFAIYQQRLQEFVGNNPDALLHFGRKNSDHIYGLLVFDNTNAFYFNLEPTVGKNSLYIYETGDYFNQRKTPDNDYSWWHKNQWDSNVEESQLKDSLKWRAGYLKNHLNSFRVYHFHDTGEKAAMKSSGPINDNRFLRENASNLAAFLYYLQEKHPVSFKKIEMAIRSIAPFFSHFSLAPDKITPGIIELVWQPKGKDAYFNAHDLSDGSLRFIALATLLLQPELPETILIDEPELGLHPVAIAKLASLVQKASAKSQVIISTQSVTLIEHFEPGDIITADVEGTQSIFRRLNNAELADWMEDYSLVEIWDKNIIGARP